MNARGSFVCGGILIAPGTFSATTDVAIKPDEGNGTLLGGGLRAQANVDASISFKMTVCTTRIAALGTGDTRAQWEFAKETEPLVNRDIETWTGLLLPSDSTSISYKARVRVVFGAGVFRFARTTDWTMLTCDLQ